MISKYAVKAFLEAPLKDLGRCNDFSMEKIDSLLSALQPIPKFPTKPYLHQKISFYAALRMKRLMLLLDMGLGKTLVMLDLIRYLTETGKVRRAMILAPTTSSVVAWKLEQEKHAPDLDMALLQGGTEDRQRVFDSAPIVVATYMGWLRMLCTVPARGKSTGDPDEKKGWALNAVAITKLASEVDLLVYDECTALKSHRSLSFKAAKMLTQKVQYRFGLTGTPFGKDPQDLWSQFYAVDGGATFGSTLGIFRQAFFTESVNYWGGREYAFIKSRTDNLKRRMASRSLRWEAKDVLDLPKQVFVKVPVDWDEESQEFYDEALKQLRASKGNVRLMRNVFLNMRRIASGLLVAVADDEGEEERIEARLPNPKLEALLEKLSEISEDRRIVIFHEFIASGDWLAEEMEKLNIVPLRLYSGEYHKEAVLRSFGRDARHRVLLANTQSGALGLNLQVANYVFFYEPPVSPIIRQQAERRCWRSGQTLPVFYLDFYIRDSVEERILYALAQGKDLLKQVLSGKEKL